MPKSGTWYCHCFFHSYHACLSFRRYSLLAALCNERLRRRWLQPDLVAALRAGKIRDKSHPQLLGLDTLYICHSICPGYRSLDDPWRSAWTSLNFYMEGYNYGETLAKEDFSFTLNPVHTNTAKIIYLFRNPLDQLVSYWRHAQWHVDPKHLTKPGIDGNRIPIKGFWDFVFNGSALDSFIKQYHTFRVVHARYPANVLMVSYEDLVAQPDQCFARMLRFMGHNIQQPKQRYSFQQALRMTTREAMIEAESALGRALANDQRIASERHVRDGKVGKWQEWFSDADVALVNERLARFGLSLEDFVIRDSHGAGSKPLAMLHA